MAVIKCGRSGKRRKNAEQKIPPGYELVPPDGNYAWVVAFACFVSGLVSTTALPIFSVLFSDVLTLYDTNTTTASWIPSITLATGNLLGPVCTVIINTFGVRKSTIIGGLALSLGMSTSFFVNKIEILCGTYGIINGFGSYICFMCFPIVLSQYFKKYYGIAVGLLSSSYAAARLVITPLAQYLLSEYGCRGVFLVLGGNMLHVCVAASLFQPVKRHLVLVPIDVDNEKLLIEDSITNRTDDTIKQEAYHEDKHDTNATSVLLSMPISDNEKNKNNIVPLNAIASANRSDNFDLDSNICMADVVTTKDTKDDVRSSNCFCLSWFRKEICGKIDFKLLHEPYFYIVCGSSFLHISLMVFTNFYLYPLGVEKGYSSIQLASIISSKAVVDIFSRVVGPSIATYFNISTRRFYISLGFVHGIILLMVVFVNSYSLLMVWAMASGMVFGAKTSLNTVLIVNTMGAKRLSSVLGLSAFIQGILLLITAPMLGWTHDRTGSFANIFIVLAILQFILITLWIIKPYLPSK